MKKPKYKTKWVYAHNIERLHEHDLLIDLASIHHVSRKMYETGKISRKVLKKWRAREKKYVDYSRSRTCKHTWLPGTVFGLHKWHSLNTGWQCLHCHTYTTGITVDKLPISFRQEPYLSRCKEILK